MHASAYSPSPYAPVPIEQQVTARANFSAYNTIEHQERWIQESHPGILGSEDTTTPTKSVPEREVNEPLQRKKQSRGVSEDTEEQKAAKKARIERTNADVLQYAAHKEDLEKLWKEGRKNPRATWYEKLYAWEKLMGISKPPPERLVRQSPKSHEPAQAQDDVGSQLPDDITPTPGMTSREEILHIREQWGKAGLNPDQCKHPHDKMPAPEYPREDDLGPCPKRPDGKFFCKHALGKFKCCQNGVDEKSKRTTVLRDLRNFRKAVEQAVIDGDLHVAHITWDHGAEKKFGRQKTSEIDGILGAVQKRLSFVAGPAGQTTIQQQQQQEQRQKVPLPHAEKSGKTPMQTESVARLDDDDSSDDDLLLEDIVDQMVDTWEEEASATSDEEVAESSKEQEPAVAETPEATASRDIFFVNSSSLQYFVDGTSDEIWERPLDISLDVLTETSCDPTPATHEELEVTNLHSNLFPAVCRSRLSWIQFLMRPGCNPLRGQMMRWKFLNDSGSDFTLFPG